MNSFREFTNLLGLLITLHGNAAAAVVAAGGNSRDITFFFSNEKKAKKAVMHSARIVNPKIHTPFSTAPNSVVKDIKKKHPPLTKIFSKYLESEYFNKKERK